MSYPTTNPPNWKELDLSTREGLRELDKIIFQRLNPTPFTFEHEVGGIYGDEIYAYRTGIDDLNDSCWDSVPAYSRVTDCILKVLVSIETYHRLELSYIPSTKGYHARLSVHIPSSESYTRSFGDTAVNPALAICIAWLEYSDALTATPAVEPGGANASGDEGVQS